MLKVVIIFLALLVNLNAYAASSETEQCERLKRLPVISKDFYQKFQDPKSTLILYDEYRSILYNRSRLSCLDDTLFDSLLEEYTRLISLTGDYRKLEDLIKKIPQKTFLFRYLGDAYKELHEAKFRLLALKNYNRYIDNGGKPNKEIKLFLKNKGLSKAKNRWFKKFSIKSVPLGSYKVIYFNSKAPNQIIKESRVAYPAVNYSHDKFPGHKLPSEDFAAYWVGDMVFDREIKKILNFKVSWSEYRLIIDGYEVSKGVKSGAEIPYLFTKGKHRIEIEYLNNYGATDFMMTMYDAREYIKTKEIKEYLSADYVLLYVGLYESDNFDSALKIRLKEKYDKPVVLLLSSYGNIHWEVNPNDNELKAIFVASSGRGSIVDLKEERTIKIYYLKDFRGETSLRIKCRCSSTYNTYCEGKSLSQFDARILNMFGKSLDGFTTLYPKERVKNRTLIVPEVSLSKEERVKIILEEQKANHIKSECQREKSLGIDDIF